MTFAPNNSLGTYLPETITIPQEEERFNEFLKTRLEEILRSLNRKDVASYEQLEQLCGQQYFGANPQNKRYVFRRVYDIGAIATGATLNTAHGLTNITEYTRIYGTVVTDVVDYRPLPRVSTVNVNQQISLDIIGINIVIVNGAASPNITNGLVVLEFVKN